MNEDKFSGCEHFGYLLVREISSTDRGEKMGFVHLHTHTQYTILDAVCKPKELIRRAEELEQAAIAITDSCNLYCAIELYKHTKKSPVKAIYGCEMWLWPEGIHTITPRSEDGGWQLALLIENERGYRNLSRLITEAIYHGIHYRPRVDLELLKQHSEGLIALTCGLNGPVGRPLFEALSSEEQTEKSFHTLSQLKEIFGKDNLFVELQDFAIPQQQQLNRTGKHLASALELRTVVTNDVRYIEPQDAVSLDLLNCISRSECVDHPQRARAITDQQYLKSEAEMRQLFPEDQDAIDRTEEIADRCSFQFKTDTYWFPATTPPDPDPERPENVQMDNKEYRADTQRNWEYFYRAFPPPRSYGMPDPEVEEVPANPVGAGNMCGYFEWYCEEGMKIRLKEVEKRNNADEELDAKRQRLENVAKGTPDAPIVPFSAPHSEQDYWDRLATEIQIIEYMGFPAYMLIVAEFINWSKDNDIPVGPGRGSAAGSIVSWAMGITDIDPLRYGLLFERFLNPERVSMPDIDVDFCRDRREEAIEHVRVKYGHDLVSQIITYGKLAAKAVAEERRTLQHRHTAHGCPAPNSELAGLH